MGAGDAKAALSADQHLSFIKQCEAYIGQLKAAAILIAAQPIAREGATLSKKKDGWNMALIDPGKEVQVGYYHILADDFEEAVAIAKRNPEFEYVPSASIEIRPVKVKEAETGFVYPQGM
jgi:hypothetical protein